MIGASKKADWAIIYGTGKMTCPDCYKQTEKEGEEAINRHIENHKRKAQRA